MTKYNKYKTDAEDARDAWRLVAGVAAIIVLVIVAFLCLFLLPGDISAGLGFRTASIVSFVVTTVLLIVFALVAGEGIFGELPMMLLGFLVFWGILTFWIAWAF